MDKTPSPDKPSIVLCMPEEKLALILLVGGFAGLVLILLGAAAALWVICGAGGVILALTGVWAVVQTKTEIVVEADRMTVRSPWAQKVYLYQGKNLLLRRSLAVTNRWMGTFGMGLADVAIQLRQGSRAEVTVPVSWQGTQSFREAMALLEGLPIPKRYL